ncbi:MAG: hypothetical protein M5U19_12220 [Microthrixaceae bacterium]|nr:hypothetical protein [Microthrixaceae bacterium]
MDLAVDFGLPIRLSGASTQEAVGFPFRDLAGEEGVLAPDHLIVTNGVGSRRAVERAVMDLRPGCDRGVPASGNGPLGAAVIRPGGGQIGWTTTICSRATRSSARPSNAPVWSSWVGGRSATPNARAEPLSIGYPVGRSTASCPSRA